MLDIQNEISVPTPLIELRDEFFLEKHLRVFVKEDYLTHPQLSGNKWRKLKYNLIDATNIGKSKLLSFGGAYSNHVYALGGVAKHTAFEVHCIIRGEELNETCNDTLAYAHENGVNLHFVSRTAYRDKERIAAEFGDEFYVIPEGGSNDAALIGVSEVIDEILDVMTPDVLIAAMGTGGTVAGLLSNNKFRGKVLGIPVLKNGNGLVEDVRNLVDFDENRLELRTDFHCGGYGKITNALRDFLADFSVKHGINLDLIYTAKLFMAVYELVRNDYFSPNQQIVIYHSGGLRG